MILKNELLFFFVTLVKLSSCDSDIDLHHGNYSNGTDDTCPYIADPFAKCWDYLECASCSILISSWTWNYVQCYGFGSCYNSSIDSLSNTTFELDSAYCSGGYSCCNTSIEFPNAIASDPNNILYCDGLSSCSNSTINVLLKTIYCNGESSCAQIPLMNMMHKYNYIYGSYSQQLNCNGFRSCDNTIFMVNNMYTYIRGYLGAVNSTFYSIYESVYYYFYGVSSGYNSTIICYDGNKCYIECHNNACNKLNIQCIGMCDITINCTYAQQSDNCPNGYDINSINGNLFPNMYTDQLTISTYQNSFLPCNHSNNSVNFICNDNQECAYQELLSNKNFNNETICCTANYACFESKNIINTGSNTRCDGSYSCTNSTIANTNGSIYATGNCAMQYSSYNCNYVSNNVNAYVDFDIFCTGTESCEWSSLSFGNNVYCSGYKGCFEATIKSVNNVWGTGFESLYGVNLSNIFNNVYCLTTCRQANIKNVTGNVMGFGPYALAEANVKNVARQVTGFGSYILTEATIQNISKKMEIVGDYGMYGATIENVTEIVCKGIGCLGNVRIEGVNYINVDGMNSLNGATIYSYNNINYKKENSNHDDNQESFEMVINDTNDETYSICCYKNNICKIACLSNNSCTNMKLYCESTCYIDCDESNSIDCPNVVYGHYVLWNSNFTKSDTIFSTTIATQQTAATATIATTAIVLTKSNKNKNKNKNQVTGNSAIMVLIIVGAVIVFVVVCVLIVWQVKKRKNRNFSQVKKEILDDRIEG